jgi:hypothetical protein
VRVRVIGLLMLLVACTPQPERVFVPGTPFKHVVEVRTSQGVSADVRVGEWLTLHARRATGPWVAVERKSLGPEGCWVAPSPPEEETEVADNLSWTAHPASYGEFNVEILSDHTRRVRFSAPGRYSLKGSSSTWCSPKVESNELTVVVRP